MFSYRLKKINKEVVVLKILKLLFFAGVTFGILQFLVIIGLAFVDEGIRNTLMTSFIMLLVGVGIGFLMGYEKGIKR